MKTTTKFLQDEDTVVNRNEPTMTANDILSLKYVINARNVLYEKQDCQNERHVPSKASRTANSRLHENGTTRGIKCHGVKIIKFRRRYFVKKLSIKLFTKPYKLKSSVLNIYENRVIFWYIEYQQFSF